MNVVDEQRTKIVAGQARKFVNSCLSAAAVSRGSIHALGATIDIPCLAPTLSLAEVAKVCSRVVRRASHASR